MKSLFAKYHLPATSTAPFCPTEIKETIPLEPGANFLQRFKRYSGVGFIVAVGYMDPGNWATDIEAGSRFGYALLCVVLISSIVAMLLQTLCVRLGVVSGRDIAQLCRERFNQKINFILWIFAQLAIIACDFAEVLGTALAMKLLFGLPLQYGILITAFDTVIVLGLQGAGLLKVEAIIIGLVLTIALAFAAEIWISSPNWHEVAKGLVPTSQILSNKSSWLIAIGIFGATVMPHNLYLHSSAVGTRRIAPGESNKEDAIRLMTYDTIITLTLAFFVNAAILVLAATAFHLTGHEDVKDIDQAYYLLAPLLGTTLASIIFGLALFASGQSSTLIGTMAGQVVLQGFLNLRIPCWHQRLATRLIAIMPAWIGIRLIGEAAIGKMLVLSQVVLSMQLPFAVVPLIMFCSSNEIMGNWKLSKSAQLFFWLLSAAIIAANIFLIYLVVK